MNRLFADLHRRSRRKKARLFVELFGPTAATRILNVGATGRLSGLADQFESFYPHHEHVVGGGLSFNDVRDYRLSFPRARAVVFDGCALPFPDQSFDIVYSNAVIEHLPSREMQRSFAREVQRVGRAWFVTTPNLWYPVELHYHLPFVQFLPPRWQQRLVGALGRVPYPALTLLGRRELGRLFPRGRVMGCRVTFYPETLIAYGPSAAAGREGGVDNSSAC